MAVRRDAEPHSVTFMWTITLFHSFIDLRLQRNAAELTVFWWFQSLYYSSSSKTSHFSTDDLWAWFISGNAKCQMTQKRRWKMPTVSLWLRAERIVSSSPSCRRLRFCDLWNVICPYFFSAKQVEGWSFLNEDQRKWTVYTLFQWNRSNCLEIDTEIITNGKIVEFSHERNPAGDCKPRVF